MSLCINDSLRKLEQLSPEKLHHTSQRLRSELGGAEWKMGVCLLATVRKRSYRKLGYSTITEYAEKALHLAGNKAGCLLGAARALEHLPVLSEAFRLGRIGWGKVRAIRGLVTPETESQWLDFALAHNTDEVARKVSLSPAAWKRHQALQASLKGEPIVSEQAVAEVLESAESSVNVGSGEPESDLGKAPLDAEPVYSSTDARSTSQFSDLGRESPRTSARCSASRPTQTEAPAAPATPYKPALPTPPKTIRLVVELTPDQYALYERAEARVRAQERKHVSRATVITKMAEAVLNDGSARSRAKHQVVVHTEAESGKAWYETERGPLPVSPLVLEQAAKQRKPVELRALDLLKTEDTTPKSQPTPVNKAPAGNTSPLRQAVPNDILRQLFALARHRCQRCGASGVNLHVHHTRPVCEGGDNSLKCLQVLCGSCHSLVHENDYATKPKWRIGRELALQRAGPGRVGGPRPP